MVLLTLSQLASLPPILRYHAASGPEPWLKSFIFDSRSAEPGTLFFALPGTHTEGERFLPDVHARGCRAVVVTRLPETPYPDTAYLIVADTRAAMSPLSDAFYGSPSRQIPVIGVTGTDGKSSTVSYIHQLLELSGRPSGFFSTVQWKVADDVEHNSLRQSTPEAPQIHQLLRQMLENGKRYAVLESTSHGLSPKTSRLADVRYECAVFTNVTSEHLEFHGTVENYRRDKSRLFEALPQRGSPTAFGVVNADDPHHDLFVRAGTGRQVYLYSLLASQAHPDVELAAQLLSETPASLELLLTWRGQTLPVQAPFPGRFNAENLLAALLAVWGTVNRQEGLDLTPLDWASYIPRLTAVKGRMRQVNRGQPFSLLIDYAHTPGAFEKLLPSARGSCQGRLITVFGSGGERDRVKRPQQGALADQWSDFIVLTDEDPRGEPSEQILADIEAGITQKSLGHGYWKIPRRAEAVAFALDLARPGDTVLLLGKGHEQTLVGPEGSAPYDEEAVALAALAQRGWS